MTAAAVSWGQIQRPAVHLGDAFHDRQAEPEPRCRLDPESRVASWRWNGSESRATASGRVGGTGVCHHQPGTCRLRFKRDPDVTAPVIVPDGVLHQVADHLGQERGIAGDWRRRQLLVDGDAALVGFGLAGGEGNPADFRQVDLLPVRAV